MATLAAGSIPAWADTNNLGPLVTGNSTFALNLYTRLKASEGNLFFSPYSISTCLAMTAAGARGETENQMVQTLHLPPDPAQRQAAFGALQKQLNDIEKKGSVQLNIANGLWAQQGHPFLPAFLETVKQNYDARLEQVDFKTDAEGIAAGINHWVSDKTKNKINNLISPGILNDLTRLVLVNAIYFKGQWTKPFNTNATIAAPFHTAPGKDVQVRLMNLTSEFKYAQTDGLQLVALPYADGSLSMVVLLPQDPAGLQKVEGSLELNKLNSWLGAARPEKVNVFLPRFKVEAQFQLKGALVALGMREPFGRKSDFSGMDGTTNLVLSAVIHKAFVDVNEQGTEAAAATAAVVAMRSVARPKPIPIFRADHPFIFLIRENSTGSILFLGRLSNPPAA